MKALFKTVLLLAALLTFIGCNKAQDAMRHGDEFYKQGKPKMAIGQYDRAITADPKLAEAHFKKAYVLSELRQFDEAIAEYEQAIRLKPDYKDALLEKGYLLYIQNRYTEALPVLDKVIELDPKNYLAIVNKAHSLRQLGLYEESLAVYDKAIEANPTKGAGAYIGKGVSLFNLGRKAEAQVEFKKGIKIDPQLKIPDKYKA